MIALRIAVCLINGFILASGVITAIDKTLHPERYRRISRDDSIKWGGFYDHQ